MDGEGPDPQDATEPYEVVSEAHDASGWPVDMGFPVADPEHPNRYPVRDPRHPMEPFLVEPTWAQREDGRWVVTAVWFENRHGVDRAVLTALERELREAESRMNTPVQKQIAVLMGARIRPPLATMEVARRYTDLVQQGESHPAVHIAKDMGIAVRTVHSHISKARRLGLLAPAPGRGRTG